VLLSVQRPALTRDIGLAAQHHYSRLIRFGALTLGPLSVSQPSPSSLELGRFAQPVSVEQDVLQLSQLTRTELMQLVHDVTAHPEDLSGLTLDEQRELSQVTAEQWDQLVVSISAQ
jgi:hypothetical protein